MLRNEYTSNWGIFSETGRKPLILFVFQHMLKFWWHLQNSKSPILKAALNTNIKISENNSKYWFSGIKRVLEWLQREDIYFAENQTLILKHFPNLKKEIYKRF